MERRELALNEIKTWRGSLIGKIKSIDELMNIPEGKEKTKLILKEKALIKKYCNLYLLYLKELWHEESSNPTQFKPKNKEEAKLHEVITPQEEKQIKESILETPKERLMRIRKEKGLI